MVCLLGPASASSFSVLSAASTVSQDQVSKQLWYFLDPSRERTAKDLLASDFAEFAPVTTNVPNFGYTKSAVWLALRFKNINDGERAWVVRFHDNFKQEFQGFVLRDDGRVERNIALFPDSRFFQRLIAHPEMNMPLEILPGETVTILVRYWTEGSSAQTISLTPRSEFDAQSIVLNARNFAFYGMICAFVMAGVFSGALFKSLISLTYSAYTSCVLLYIMHIDGTAFQYLYPNAPAFNNYASIVWGGGFIFFGAIYARLFLRVKPEFPRIDIALRLVAVSVIGFGFATLFIDPQVVKRGFVFLALVGIITFVVAGLIVARRYFREVRFFVIAWTGAVVSSVLMNLGHQLGMDISPTVQMASLRITIAGDAALMGLAILDRYNQLKNARQGALEQVIHTSQRNLELAQRLSDLQDQSAQLEKRARDQGQAFADRIHDLRQPLSALRLRIKHGTVSGDMTNAQYHEMTSALSYLETLIKDFEAEPPNIRTLNLEKTKEKLSLNDVLKAIHDMFLPDAHAKGVEFRYVICRQNMDVDPLIVMRIIVNLVSNAVRYSESGKILMGCRRKQGFFRIEVHDTGCGMTAAEFEQALAREIRLPKSANLTEGTGNGMAIARELARQHNWDIVLLPRKSQGTSLGVVIPIISDPIAQG